MLRRVGTAILKQTSGATAQVGESVTKAIATVGDGPAARADAKKDYWVMIRRQTEKSPGHVWCLLSSEESRHLREKHGMDVTTIDHKFDRNKKKDMSYSSKETVTLTNGDKMTGEEIKGAGKPAFEFHSGDPHVADQRIWIDWDMETGVNYLELLVGQPIFGKYSVSGRVEPNCIDGVNEVTSHLSGVSVPEVGLKRDFLTADLVYPITDYVKDLERETGQKAEDLRGRNRDGPSC